MRLAALGLALVLTACASRPAEPVVVVREVAKPVPVRCVPEAPQPAPRPTESVSLDANVFDLGKAFAGDRAQLIVETLNLRAALKGCAGPDAAAARLVTP